MMVLRCPADLHTNTNLACLLFVIGRYSSMVRKIVYTDYDYYRCIHCRTNFVQTYSTADLWLIWCPILRWIWSFMNAKQMTFFIRWLDWGHCRSFQTINFSMLLLLRWKGIYVLFAQVVWQFAYIYLGRFEKLERIAELRAKERKIRRNRKKSKQNVKLLMPTNIPQIFWNFHFLELKNEKSGPQKSVPLHIMVPC